jgi:hypothetical protein
MLAVPECSMQDSYERTAMLCHITDEYEANINLSSPALIPFTAPDLVCKCHAAAMRAVPDVPIEAS